MITMIREYIMNISIAEDDETMRKILKLYLQKQDYFAEGGVHRLMR